MMHILIIGFFESIFLAVLVLTKKNKTFSDYILTCFFFVFSLNILFSYIEAYNRQNNYPFPEFIFTAAPLLLLHGPLLWLYTKSLTTQHFKLKPIYLLNLIPFLAMLLQHLFEVYLLPVDKKIYFVQTEAFKQYYSYPLFIIIIALSPIFYFLWILSLIKNFKLKIESYFSQTQGIDLKWLRLIIVSWLVFFCFINSFFIVDLFYPVASFGLMQFVSFSLGAIYIIFIGFYGLKQQNIFYSNSIKFNLENNYSEKIDNNFEKKISEGDKEFIDYLLKFMLEQKPYLETEITLKLLSDKLNVSSEYLSEVLNTNLNKNFFDFINYYRIEEFKIQCKDEKNKKYTIIAIAYNCGFNSKATFNRVFKKATGLTPSEYINKSQ